MKKRFLSLLLAVCMVLTILPTTVLAATNYNIWVGSTQVTSDNASNVLGDGTVSFDAATSTLTLNNANIASDTGFYEGSFTNYLINFGQTATLNLVGNNIIDASGKGSVSRLCGINTTEGSILTITGSGTLSVKGGTATGLSSGIAIQALLIIDGCQVTAYNEDTIANYIQGIWDWGSYGVTVKNGATLTMGAPSSNGYGIFSNTGSSLFTIDDTSTVIVQGGNRAAYWSMHAVIDNPNLIIKGSTNYDGIGATRIYSNSSSVKYIKVEPAPVEAPSIETNPSNQMVNKGQTATFIVSATSTVSCTYQWQVSTNSGSSWANVADGTGGTSQSYTTASATTAMNGYIYRCQVTNSGGTATSNAATLTVLESPASADFTFTPPTASLTYDGTAKTATVNSDKTGMGDITVKYYKDGATTGTTTVPTEAGTYTVKVDVAQGTAYTAATDISDNSWSFTISPLDITGATVGTFSALTYDGTAQTPSAAVTKNSLTATGTWSAVTSVGQTTTFTASGNFTGTIADINPNMAKGTPNYTVPTGLTAIYGQILADVALPSGFSWTNSATSVGSVGTRSFTVIYTPADTANYNTVSNITVSVIVSAKQTTFSIDDIAAVTYSGSAQTPAVVVKDGVLTLTKDTDYTVAYSSNTNAGTATVTVTGKGNYAGSNGTKTFTISPLDITDATVGTFEALTYTDAAQTPAATVTKNSLTATGTWSAVTSVGETTTFTASGNFMGTIADKNPNMAKATPRCTAPTGLTAIYGQTLADVALPTGFAWTDSTTSVGSMGTHSFTVIYTPADTANYNTVSNITVSVIVSAKQTTFSIDDIAAVTYSGSAQTPAVVVKDGVLILTEDTDYTVSYTDNTNAGTATVTVTGKGNYEGNSGVKAFTISPLDITDATVGTFEALTYTGAAQTPAATVTKNSLTVTGTWSKVTNATDKTTFTASGNFTGTISDQNPGMAKATPRYTAPTGLTAIYGQTLADVALPSGFAWTNSATSVGSVGTRSFTATYTPTDTVNYNTLSNIAVDVEVLAKQATFSVDDIAAVTYSGTAQTPTAVVKDGIQTLTKDVDYTVDYSSNTDAGTATVTVTGAGNYAGSNGTKTFTINPLDITGATVGAFAALTYNGTAQTPSATVTKNSLTATGTWSAVTSVGQTTTFTASGNFTGTIADKNPGMAKATPSYTVPTGLTAAYGQTLAEVALPPEFAWTNSATSVGNPGTRSFTASYTPTDSANYNTVNNIDISVTVAAKNVTFAIDDIAEVTYNGTAHTPAVVVKDGALTLTKDTDYTVSYNNNTDAGTATVTVTGKGNYAGSSGTKTFVINRANITNSKNDQAVTYAGETYDVTQLFTLDSNAGTPSYAIEAGGTGEGTLSGNLLTITKAGTIAIGVSTAQTENYNAGSMRVATLTVNKGAQNAPVGITKLNASAKDGNDGKIQNVSTAMEYKAEGGEYTDVTGTEISGLSKGVYSIRCKQTEVYNASADTQITIDEPTVIKADETVPDGITLETPTLSGDQLVINVAKASVVAPEITTISGSKAMGIVIDITAEVNSLPTVTLPHLIKITLPIPDAAKGRSITVYRLHEGVAEVMPVGEENKNADGEYIVIGTDTIVIYAKNFSQYAIAYTRPSSGGSSTTTYKITVTQSEGGKISPDTVSVTKYGSKTFTITSNDGYEIEDVLVNGKSVGKVGEYTFQNVTSAASITAKFKKIEENPAPSPEPTEPTNPAKWENPFTDVNEKDWFYEAVKYVSENGLMNGTDNTTFAPNMDVTRAMFVTVLYRAEKQPNAGFSSFTDIESGSYYEKAVAWAAANGIVKGVSETEFVPNSTITREQMAAIIQRYAVFKGFDAAAGKTTSYADSANISDYAKEAVAFCTEQGIMSGKGEDIFAPQEYATRAEVAAVLERVLKILQ